MKSLKKYFYGLIMSLLLVMTVSCEDFALGEKFLQKPPSGDVTIDTIFSTADNARKVLWFSYSKLPYGIPTGYNYTTAMWYGVLEGLTDLAQSELTWDGVNMLYYNGAYNAGSEDGGSGGSGGTKYRFLVRDAWKGIRHAWILIENIDRVPDMSPEEKSRLKAEAKIIIATLYADMFRHFGALPIIDRAIDAEATEWPARATLQQTIDFMVRLLDEANACQELPWAINGGDAENWNGRLTRASALGLKLRILLFAASPLFNSDQPYCNGTASDAKMTWFGGYDKKRWDDAAAAGKQFMDELQKNGFYELVKEDGNLRMGFRNGYYQRGSTESLISSRRQYKASSNNNLMWSVRWGAWCPTKEYFDMFPMADGSDFDWNNPDHKKNPFVNRDPRLGETILLDGDIFGAGKAEVYQKFGNDKNYPNGKDWKSKSALLDAKSLESGIAVRKFVLDRQGEYKQALFQWPYLRLAEVFLSYAEALNEANGGPNELAYEYINKIRNRVGLKDLQKGLSQEQFREAILRERACEFGFEEVRFFDLVRWKREADFTKRLHGLNVYRNKATGEYKFAFPQLRVRAWQKQGGFSSKWYLSAFPPKEINKGYGLVQNPGWE